ncbi:MAG TPA: hypothetical protein VIG33_01395 [Pseudobdellovibrionaceae bacterium]|jgi:hypothetical protein
MKFTITLASLLLILSTALTVHAGTATMVKKHSKKNSQAKLGTSFKFDGSNLRGKYQNSLSTTATVENDKFLEDLLGGRTQFEDRDQKERERN